jgi:hypothetical protein
MEYNLIRGVFYSSWSARVPSNHWRQFKLYLIAGLALDPAESKSPREISRLNRDSSPLST